MLSRNITVNATMKALSCGPTSGRRAPEPRRRASSPTRARGSGAGMACPYRAGRGPHIAEAQVVEEIEILEILAEELLQVDAGLVELAGGEELVGAGEDVGHGGISPNADGRLLYIFFRASVDSFMG